MDREFTDGASGREGGGNMAIRQQSRLLGLEIEVKGLALLATKA